MNSSDTSIKPHTKSFMKTLGYFCCLTIIFLPIFIMVKTTRHTIPKHYAERYLPTREGYVWNIEIEISVAAKNSKNRCIRCFICLFRQINPAQTAFLA